MSTIYSKKLYYGDIKQKHNGGFSVSKNGVIYVNRDKNRSYWVLQNIPRAKRPKFRYNDKLNKISIGKNIGFFTKKDYNLAKKYILKF